jgi:hypothetical protein
MRSGTYFSTSKCVCKHHFTCPLPDCRLSSDASAIAANGAGLIHDFELALVGGTSEDVAK